jgi:choline dehydrogenase-like flavoprotein
VNLSKRSKPTGKKNSRATNFKGNSGNEVLLQKKQYHETNALIERVNRSIMAIARPATIGVKMPKNTRSDATQWATYMKNRMPHKTTGKSPLEMLLKRDPATERKNLQKYGEWAWVHDYTATGKLEPRAVKARINYTNIMCIWQLMYKEGGDYLKLLDQHKGKKVRKKEVYQLGRATCLKPHLFRKIALKAR